MREQEEVADGVFIWKQCQVRFSMRFDSEEEAESFVEAKQVSGDLACSIGKEQGYTEWVEGMSNFTKRP